MYTMHGHHIPFTPLDEQRPTSVARCGGPRICPKCSLEASFHVPAFKEAAKSSYHRREGDMDFLARARRIVYDYVNPMVDKTDPHVTFGLDDVYIVWFSKTLQNWKAVLSTTLPDGMYYELTYNGDKRETYMDAYKKLHNLAIPDSSEESDLSASQSRDRELSLGA